MEKIIIYILGMLLTATLLVSCGSQKAAAESAEPQTQTAPPPPGIAPRVNYTVKGRVQNSNGRPVKGLEVILLNSSIDASEDYLPDSEHALKLMEDSRDTTDRKGRFECSVTDLNNRYERLLVRDIDGKSNKHYANKMVKVEFSLDDIRTNARGQRVSIAEKEVVVTIERMED